MFRRIKNDISISHNPLVIITAKNDIFPELTGLEKGADVYLLIPIDEIGLQSIVKNLNGSKLKLCGHYVSETLSEITNRSEAETNDRFTQKILSLMDMHMDDDQFGIAELSDALGMSRAQIYRKFKSLIDWTPHDYFRTYRLHKARQLLLTTKINVSEAAYLTGFKNLSHFSRVFAEEFGKSPSEFST